MQVILVERVGKLGGIGDVIEVKRGYGRNFLLPKGKALRATKDNLDYLKTKKSELEAANLRQKAEAEKVAQKMQDVSITIIRQASESGYLFGSVRPNDIVLAISKHGFHITKSQAQIDKPIKTIGTYTVGIVLHPEVRVNISLRVMTAQEQEVTDTMEPNTDEQPLRPENQE